MIRFTGFKAVPNAVSYQSPLSMDVSFIQGAAALPVRAFVLVLMACKACRGSWVVLPFSFSLSNRLLPCRSLMSEPLLVDFTTDPYATPPDFHARTPAAGRVCNSSVEVEFELTLPGMVNYTVYNRLRDTDVQALAAIQKVGCVLRQILCMFAFLFVLFFAVRLRQPQNMHAHTQHSCARLR